MWHGGAANIIIIIVIIIVNLPLEKHVAGHEFYYNVHNIAAPIFGPILGPILEIIYKKTSKV
jgi:hypothetical protein